MRDAIVENSRSVFAKKQEEKVKEESKQETKKTPKANSGKKEGAKEPQSTSEPMIDD